MIRAIFVWLAYKLRLRAAHARFMQWARERHAPRMRLETFQTVDQVTSTIKLRFRYRREKVDFVSHPEVVQARLKVAGPDEDCDGLHWWACCVLLSVPDVERALFCSVGIKRAEGRSGHCFAIIKRKSGEWEAIDYWKTYPLDDPNDAGDVIARARGGRRTFFVSESVDPAFRLVAVHPISRIQP